jgi:hypothetical protein
MLYYSYSYSIIYACSTQHYQYTELITVDIYVHTCIQINSLNPLGKTLNLWMLRPVMMKKLAIKTIELLDGNEDKEITRQEFLNAM